MTALARRIARGGTACVLGAFTLLGLSYMAGARVNSTKSIPLGLYWASERPVRTGEYVLFCPPQNELMAQARQRGYLGPGRCPGGYGYMMKRVLAVGGDLLSISPDGVLVNGVKLPHSAPLAYDGARRPLPRFETSGLVVNADQFLPMSDVSSTSFDGRYFGPIKRRQIETVIVPVWTW